MLRPSRYIHVRPGRHDIGPSTTFNRLSATTPKIAKRKPQVERLRFSLFSVCGWAIRIKRSRWLVSWRVVPFGSSKCLFHDLIRLDEFLIVADVLSGVLDFGQQEVVDDLYDHRGAHLGEREVPRCQQCLVIDSIKGVVG